MKLQVGRFDNSVGLGRIRGVLGGYVQGQHEVEVQIWDKDVRHTKSVKDFNRTIGSIKIE